MSKDIIILLADAIIKSNMPITEISRKSKITRPMIYKIIKKEIGRISMDTVQQICKAINIKPSDLIDGNKPNNHKAVKIPVLGAIPAGTPIEAVQDIVDYEEISTEMASHGSFFALKVSGNSMLPTIKDGDTVVIRQQEDADSGKICVVMVNGYDATLKEIKKEPNGIWILPHNPSSDFKPTFYSNNEIEHLPIKIIGVAVEIRRSL